MRVLITGAGGNLGGKLRRYLEDRHELVLLSRSSRGDAAIHAADLTVWSDAWTRLFADVDVVVHLAANPSPRASWAELVGPNIDMVLHVYTACAFNSVRRVVFASSNHVLGGYSDALPPLLRGDTPPWPDSPYGATKLMGERIGKSFSERYGISSINVRIGMNRKDGTAPGAGMDEWQRRMWLSDGDYCRLMECCINAPLSVRCAVINGMSANTGMSWDLAEARALLGYAPEDNAYDAKWS